MPYGGNDWLDLNQEESIEPELPICDPHHHFWDLRSERTPYGKYLLNELLSDFKDHNIKSTVFLNNLTLMFDEVTLETKQIEKCLA